MPARIHSAAAFDALEYQGRGGRVSLVMFSPGTILQPDALLRMHADKGVTDRARTSNGAIARPKGVALVHADAPGRLEQLRREVEEKLPSVPVLLEGEVAPVIGAHVGPGAVGIVWVQAPAA